jgi:high-affinity K+ transport system ATPase subunit B
VKIDENQIAFIVKVLTANVAEELAALSGKPTTDALREFMSTKTYNVLMKPNSLLYRESPAYVVDMVKAERSGDWSRWLEV